jgi:hypothetical protein
MRGRDSRLHSVIPVTHHQPRRRSPCTATSPVMETSFCGILVPAESDCVPSIRELHGAWERMFVDAVNIGDAAGPCTQPEKSLLDTRKRFHAAMVSAIFEDLWNRFPDRAPASPCTFCMCLDISQTNSNVLWEMFTIYDAEADVVPGCTSWLVVEVWPCTVRVAHRSHVQDLLRCFHTHFPAVRRSTSVRVLSRLGCL